MRLSSRDYIYRWLDPRIRSPSRAALGYREAFPEKLWASLDPDLKSLQATAWDLSQSSVPSLYLHQVKVLA